MTTAPIIREASAGDIPALLALYESVGGRPAGYAEQCLGEQQAGRRFIYMTEDGGGVAMLNWQPLYSLYRRLGLPEIQDLIVLPARRRAGIGAGLVAHCERVAAGKGCSAIGISVGLTASYGAAQRLYVRLGYVPDGYGVTYDRQTVAPGEFRPVDDNLCLMMVKDVFV